MIWRGKKPRPRVAPPRIQKKKMNPELAKKMLEKYQNKPYKLNKQDSDDADVLDKDLYSPERFSTALKLTNLREKKKGKKVKRIGGKKKRKRTKKKKRRRRKRTKKKRRRRR